VLQIPVLEDHSPTHGSGLKVYALQFAKVKKLATRSLPVNRESRKYNINEPQACILKRF
jgi:hypothetical protein